MASMTITLDTPVDALVLRTALSVAIKSYDDSIAFWNSDERTMSREGRDTVLDTLYADKRRLELIQRDVASRLDAVQRRMGGGVPS